MFVILIFEFTDGWLPIWAAVKGAAVNSAPVPNRFPSAALRLTWDGGKGFFEDMIYHSDRLE